MTTTNIPASDKEVRLVMISDANNNKFYNMIPKDSSTWEAHYGRVGGSKTVETYPISKWATKYKEKTKKGYKDVTEYFVVEGTTNEPTKLATDYMSGRSSAVIEIVKRLQQYANKSVADNYTVSAEKVTPKQVEAAQIALDKIAKQNFDNKKLKEINSTLLELYHIIPRKMTYVPDFLLSEKNTAKENEEKFSKIMQTEQDTLDVMAGQVKTIQAQREQNPENDTNADKVIDIIEAAGLEIVDISDAEIEQIKKQMQGKAKMFKKAFKVVNKKTQKAFDTHLANAANTKCELFWHGSRTENWWSIMTMGLMIRPSGAVYSGSMYADGIYFASEFDKSLGYTSISGSRWASGSNNFAFLALYNVHVGKQLVFDRHTSECSKLSKKYLKDKGDYDSTWAKKGVSLYRDEYIVYDSAQCTIAYLVEVEGSQY